MEVHTHTSTPRKKWTHYFWEFLMLFLAVFCGFMAENYREHQIEHRREKRYMQSLISDLENDRANLAAGFPRKEGRIAAIDSVFLFFEKNPFVTEISGALHWQMLRTNYDVLYRRNTTTIDQLKYAGGMRLIRKKNVADSIAAYDLKWIRAELWQEIYVTQQDKEKQLLSKIIEAADLLTVFRTNSNTFHPKIADTMRIRINRAFLNEFLNELTFQKTTTSRDREAHKNLETYAELLIKLIKEEYHLK